VNPYIGSLKIKHVLLMEPIWENQQKDLGATVAI
jgi:hypothetical protein